MYAYILIYIELRQCKFTYVCRTKYALMCVCVREREKESFFVRLFGVCVCKGEFVCVWGGGGRVRARV